MSDTPGVPTLEEREAKLAEQQKSLEAQQEELKKGREDFEALQGTLSTIAENLKPRQPAPPPPPEEPLPTDEDFQHSSVAASAQIAGKVMKAGMSEYHKVIAPEIESLKSGQKEWEKEKVRAIDPVAYDHLKKEIEEELDKYNYTPGLVKKVFDIKRGEKFDEISQIKRDKAAADAATSEPVAEPNTPMGTRRSRAQEPEYDTLTRYQIDAIRGLRINPKEYVLAQLGREPNFEEGYLKRLGLPDEEVGSATR